MNSPSMATKEVKNGRLAMTAFVGFAVQVRGWKEGEGGLLVDPCMVAPIGRCSCKSKSVGSGEPLVQQGCGGY